MVGKVVTQYENEKDFSKKTQSDRGPPIETGSPQTTVVLIQY